MYFTGENNSSYTIHPVTVSSAGRYYCQIENQYGVVNSTVATVTVTTSSTIIHPSLGKRNVKLFFLKKRTYHVLLKMLHLGYKNLQG